MKDMQWALRWLAVFVVSCLAGVVIGLWLDQLLHTTPIFILLLVAYAIIGNFYKLWKEMSKDE